MQIVMRKTSELTPYAHNPRDNAGAVDADGEKGLSRLSARYRPGRMIAAAQTGTLCPISLSPWEKT